MEKKRIKYIKCIKFLDFINVCCFAGISLTFIVMLGSYLLPDIEGVVKRAILILLVCGALLVFSMFLKDSFNKKIKQNKHIHADKGQKGSLYEQKQSLENYKRNNKKYTLQGIKEGVI